MIPLSLAARIFKLFGLADGEGHESVNARDVITPLLDANSLALAVVHHGSEMWKKLLVYALASSWGCRVQEEPELAVLVGEERDIVEFERLYAAAVAAVEAQRAHMSGDDLRLFRFGVAEVLCARAVTERVSRAGTTTALAPWVEEEPAAEPVETVETPLPAPMPWPRLLGQQAGLKLPLPTGM